MRTSRQLPPRTGLTLVEVLVALVLVSVGLLGISGAAAIAMRAAAMAAREREAVARAEQRLAILRSAGCGAATSGASGDAGAGIREAWTVEAPVAGFAPLTAEVEWLAPRSSSRSVRRLVLRGAVQC